MAFFFVVLLYLYNDANEQSSVLLSITFANVLGGTPYKKGNSLKLCGDFPSNKTYYTNYLSVTQVKLN